MTKKLFLWMLMATLTCGLSMGFASCSDDDDDNTGKENHQEKHEELTGEEAERALKFWNVVGQLVSTSDYTPDYADKTFEPTYGIESESNPLVRIVNTNDMATAAQRFANLVGVDGIDANTASYEWSDPDVGTLSYRKTDDGTSLAVVDVDIKQVRGLQQIVYQTPEQSGANGKFNGTAYYRFGDVVKRVYNDPDDDNKQKTEYWVCVRPAFGPEGKSDSHWVSVSPLPTKNIEEIEIEDYHFSVPTGIGVNVEQMQNFAEMLFAIGDSHGWSRNLDQISAPGFFSSGLPMFHDFARKNKKYHNEYFWGRVRRAWKEKDIVRTVFGTSSAFNEFYNQNIFTNGLKLLVSGYSWWSSVSRNLTLYEYTFFSGESSERNMHKMTYREVKKDVGSNLKDGANNPMVIDIAKECTEKRPYVTNAQFFGDTNSRFIIRHATGKDLAGFKPDVHKTLANGNNGLTDVYCYNLVYNNGKDLKTLQPEETPTETVYENTPTDGSGVFMLGDVLKDNQGNRYFCITGSPWSPAYQTICNDHTAYFISFDGITSDQHVANNIVSEDEAILIAQQLCTFCHMLVNTSGRYQMNVPTGELGDIGEHVKEYTGVDLLSIMAYRDSTLRFKTDQGVYVNSNSVTGNFNIAYNDGNHDKQALLRVVHDKTLAGSKRTESYPGYKDWFYRCYKHYQTYDQSNLANANDETLKKLEINNWCHQWPVTTDRIYLQDLADANKVATYAKGDKWVILPTAGTVKRGTPRKKAYSSVKPTDFIFVDGKQPTDRTGMYNEPVLFFRVLKVKDEGVIKDTYTATDGTQLKIVHLMDDNHLYKATLQGMWFVPYTSERKNSLFLDNAIFELPPVPGTENL